MDSGWDDRNSETGFNDMQAEFPGAMTSGRNGPHRRVRGTRLNEIR